MNRPIPPSKPPPDLSHYLIKGRWPNLVAICEDSIKPIYGVVGGPLGLKLSSVTFRRDDQEAKIEGAILTYQSANLRIQVKLGNLHTGDDPGKVEWAERYEFASKYGVKGEPVRIEASHQQVASLWRWSGNRWLAKCQVGSDVIFLGAVGLEFELLDILLSAIARIDDRPEILLEQQEQLWDRLREL